MRHKKDHAEPPIRAIVLALTAVIVVTLVVQSLVSHRGVPAALTRYARSDHAQNAANRVPAHLPASAAWHVAPAASRSSARCTRSSAYIGDPRRAHASA